MCVCQKKAWFLHENEWSLSLCINTPLSSAEGIRHGHSEAVFLPYFYKPKLPYVILGTEKHGRKKKDMLNW